ncbi:MAG: hypothetical protein SH821_03950 [Phototrophicales bacterium]|nr:hypothetical protein [Phototrophicales bacterium]
MMWRFILVMLMFCIVTIPTVAQEPQPEATDEVTFFDIPYDMPVQGSLTDSTYFDFWRFNAQAGDELLVRMRGDNGLAPLVGIAGSNREVIVRSDIDAEGVQLPDAEPNSTIELRFLVPMNGEFAVVATRAGRELGATVGEYTLVLTVTSSDSIRRDQIRNAVEFRCGADIVNTALTIQLPPVTQSTTYRVSVYGLDAFEPAIRVLTGFEDDYLYCTTDGQNTVGDTIAFGDILPPITIDESTTRVAQYGINADGNAGQITFTIASVGGGRGRYIAVIEGLSLTEANQVNPLDLQMGPLALGSTVTIYMVKLIETRLDPYMAQTTNEGTLLRCDDAGGRGCETVPNASNLRITLQDGTLIQGDRFSAGLSLTPESVDLLNLQFVSRATSATGGYAVVIIGELPVLP